MSIFGFFEFLKFFLKFFELLFFTCHFTIIPYNYTTCQNDSIWL